MSNFSCIIIKSFGTGVHKWITNFWQCCLSAVCLCSLLEYKIIIIIVSIGFVTGCWQQDGVVDWLLTVIDWLLTIRWCYWLVINCYWLVINYKMSFFMFHLLYLSFLHVIIFRTSLERGNPLCHPTIAAGHLFDFFCLSLLCLQKMKRAKQHVVCT